MSSPSLQEGKLLKHRAFLYLGLLGCKGLKTTLGAMSNLGKMAASSARDGGFGRKYMIVAELGPRILHVFRRRASAFLLGEISGIGIANSLSWPTS
jgi:hypothetical protein